jgi:hypothetical protein
MKVWRGRMRRTEAICEYMDSIVAELEADQPEVLNETRASRQRNFFACGERTRAARSTTRHYPSSDG